MRARRWPLALAATVALLVGAIGVLWLGAAASLDYSERHRAATCALPRQSAARDGLLRIDTGELVFRARAAGLGGKRGNVIMLHGFARTSAMWAPLLSAAAKSGYQALAFDQRGYSPGARPLGRPHYAMDALVGDMRRVAKAMGFSSFHLIGHELGARVGWQAVLGDPSTIATWTAIAMPHPHATEAARRYPAPIHWPWLPEQVLAFNRFEVLRNTLWADEPAAVTREYLTVLSEPGALTAALQWLRVGLPAPPPSDRSLPPSLLIWNHGDPLLTPATLEIHRDQVGNSMGELELANGEVPMARDPGLLIHAVLSHLKTGG